MEREEDRLALYHADAKEPSLVLRGCECCDLTTSPIKATWPFKSLGVGVRSGTDEGHPEKETALRIKSCLEFLRQGKHTLIVLEAAMGRAI